ncbi:hypothetical protein [Noviherbaspirillum cavernae]|uniref:hypothetical protein n=1 Tax=Noviherbaspirillum cavernae TaxID=2320862 RepID=UPI0018F39A0B|nr:hypothetical protein [Noviherbaspirillum cavernae]
MALSLIGNQRQGAIRQQTLAIAADQGFEQHRKPTRSVSEADESAHAMGSVMRSL